MLTRRRQMLLLRGHAVKRFRNALKVTLGRLDTSNEKFSLNNQLGTGAFGAVFHVRKKVLKPEHQYSDYAVKVLAPGKGYDSHGSPWSAAEGPGPL